MRKNIVQLSKRALKDLKAIKKSGRKLDMEKVQNFLIELEEHPRTGTGSPEQLKYYDGEVWSREVNKKDRFVYDIFEEEISVMLVQSLGHYNDK